MTTPATPDLAGLTIESDIPYLPDGMRVQYKEDFVYNVQMGTIVGGGQATNQIAIDSGSYFAVVAQTAVVYDPTTPQTPIDPIATGLRVFMQAGSSAVAYANTNNGVHIGQWFGTAERPFYWVKRGLLWKAGDNINFTVFNITGAQSYAVELAFSGFKIFLSFDDSIDATPRS